MSSFDVTPRGAPRVTANTKITPAERDELKHLATEHGVTMSHYVRALIVHHLAEVRTDATANA